MSLTGLGRKGVNKKRIQLRGRGKTRALFLIERCGKLNILKVLLKAFKAKSKFVQVGGIENGREKSLI